MDARRARRADGRPPPESALKFACRRRIWQSRNERRPVTVLLTMTKRAFGTGCTTLIALSLFVCTVSAAQLALVREVPGTAFDISSDGAMIAAIEPGRICLHAVVSAAGDCFESPLALDLHMNGRLRWSPDRLQLAVSGPESAVGGAVWIFDLSGGPSGEPRRVYATGSPGPGVGIVNVVDWINRSELLVWIGRAGYRILDLDAGTLTGCGWDDMDGSFERLADLGVSIASNRFGDMLIAREQPTAAGTRMLCEAARQAESTPRGLIWNQFEDRLSAQALLFSQQIYDRGAQWRIGAPLALYDAATLDFVTELPSGAPASVSPDQRLIAALRQSADESVAVHVYRTTDFLPVAQIPVALTAAPGTDDLGIVYSYQDWAAIRPKWSPSGAYVLIRTPAGSSTLVSIGDKTGETVLAAQEPILDADWTTDNRVFVRSASSIRIYDIVD